MTAGLTASALDGTIQPHPTAADAVRRAATAWLGTSRLAAWVKRGAGVLLGATRPCS